MSRPSCRPYFMGPVLGVEYRVLLKLIVPDETIAVGDPDAILCRLRRGNRQSPIAAAPSKTTEDRGKQEQKCTYHCIGNQ
ncbi:MAG: hypothetical protein E7105_02950 [Prevotella sp.]|nr:hypothetical protein [Prevotella sp.]